MSSLAIAIAGMHRSGTSLVAKALHDAGVHLGETDDLLPAAPDNPEGFWENVHFVRLNERLLLRFGGAWDLPPKLNSGWQRSADLDPLRDEAQALVRQFANHAVWGWKDPRNSLTIAFWREQVSGLRTVVCLRNPLDVAASLARRNQMSLARGLVLWAEYNSRVLSAVPRSKRVITHFDCYFRAPEDELRRLLTELRLPVTAESLARATQAVSPSLGRTAATRDDLTSSGADLEIARLYDAMCDEAGPVYNALPTAGRLGGAAPTLERAATSVISIGELRGQIAHRDDEINTIRTVAAADQERVERDRVALQQRLNSARAELTDATQRLELAQVRMSVTEAEHSRLARELDSLENGAGQLRAQLDALESDREALRDRTSHEITTLEADLARIAAERDAHHEASRVAAHDRDLARTEVERLRVEQQRTSQELATAAAAAAVERDAAAERALEFESGLGALQAELTTLNATITETAARRTTLEAELARIVAERDAHHEASRVAAHDRDVARAEVERLRVEQQRTSQELGEQLREALVRRDVLEGERAAAAAAREAAVAAAAAAAIERDAALQQGLEFRPRVSALEADLARIVAERDAHHEASRVAAHDRDLARTEVARISAELQRTSQELGEQLREALIRRDALEGEGAAAVAARDAAVAAAAAAAAARDAALQRTLELEPRLGSLQAELTTLNATLTETAARRTTLEAELARIAAERDAHHEASRVAAHDRDVARAEVERLRVEQQRTSQELASTQRHFEAERAQARRAIAGRELRLKQLINDVARDQERLTLVREERGRDIAEREGTIRSLYSEIATTIIQRDAHHEASRVAAHDRDVARAEVERLSVELRRTSETLEADLARTVAERDAHHETSRVAASDRDIARAEVERLSAELQQTSQTLEADLARTVAERDAHHETSRVAASDRDIARESARALGDQVERQRLELERTSAELDTARTESSRLRGNLNLITSSSAWALITTLWRIRLFIAPHGSRRERFLVTVKHGVASLGQRQAQPPKVITPAPKRARTRRSFVLLRRAPRPAPAPLVEIVRTAETRTGRYDVIVFPVIDWAFRFQRPQQLAMQFARNGHRVFYAATTFRVEGDVRIDPTITVDPIRADLFVRGLTLPATGPMVIYRDEVSRETVELWVRAFDKLKREHLIDEAVCVIQLPFWLPLVVELRRRFGWRVVYDCMDRHAGFSTNSDAALRGEAELSRTSDLVVVSSRSLFADQRRFNERCELILNAADFEHFSVRLGAIAERIVGLRHPVVGYYGAISDWFDTELVGALARLRPQWSFVLIGSTYGADLRPLSGLANVHLIGEQPYQAIPDYLHGFDVCFIPFKLTPLTEATDPVKFYEFLSAGKPIISTPLPELRDREGTELVSFASSPEEFARSIELELARDGAERADERRRFARRNTWTSRFGQLADAIRPLYPRISVVVLTYNNLELTKLCIESILRNTRWPNVELIVVDNASRDGTPDYLHEIARQHPEILLLLNDDNRGFAAGNNQGIQASSGDYVVLLNNDTIVSPGWLGSFVRHAQQDPTVGLVGPVTNATGNEAKIPVTYSSIEEMERFAQQRAIEFAGRSFEMNMVAMFATLIPRRVLDEIGLLDERYKIGMFEDDDFAMRVKQRGYRVICAEDVFVHHFMSAALKQLPEAEYRSVFEANKRRFEEKWGTQWQPHRYRPVDTAAAIVLPTTPTGTVIGNGEPAEHSGS